MILIINLEEEKWGVVCYFEKYFSKEVEIGSLTFICKSLKNAQNICHEHLDSLKEFIRKELLEWHIFYFFLELT